MLPIRCQFLPRSRPLLLLRAAAAQGEEVLCGAGEELVAVVDDVAAPQTVPRSMSGCTSMCGSREMPRPLPTACTRAWVLALSQAGCTVRPCTAKTWSRYARPALPSSRRRRS